MTQGQRNTRMYPRSTKIDSISGYSSTSKHLDLSNYIFIDTNASLALCYVVLSARLKKLNSLKLLYLHVNNINEFK